MPDFSEGLFGVYQEVVPGGRRLCGGCVCWVHCADRSEEAAQLGHVEVVDVGSVQCRRGAEAVGLDVD